MIRGLLFFCLYAVCMVAPAEAQDVPKDAPVVLNPTSEALMIQSAKSAREEKQETTLEKLGADYYAPMSRETLANLYWRTGVVLPDNEQAVKEYMGITSCDILKKNENNDFTWPHVLETAQNYIRKYAVTFPTQIQYIQPIELGKYNLKQEEFEITPISRYVNKSNLVFADYTGQAICRDGLMMMALPPIAEIRLSTPFNLVTLPIKADFAKTLVDFMELRPDTIYIKDVTVKRYAYVTFFITILAVNDVADNKYVARFNGQLDGYEIYMDFDKTLPVTKWINE